MAKRVLLAEDDQDFRSILQQYLQMFDYTIDCAKDGKEALTLFKNETYDICILDVMMPKMDGFTLAEKMVEINPEVPFIFLTARKMKEDRLRGLKLGADDYIVKPFEAEELVLRLKNILKRNANNHEAVHEANIWKISEYTFDSSRLELSYQGNVAHLTKKEATLVEFLFHRRNTLIKRDEILLEIWGSADFFSGRSMDVFVSRLRKYFKMDPKISIESIRGVGLEFRING